jgi:hypothetical protein
MGGQNAMNRSGMLTKSPADVTERLAILSSRPKLLLLL